MATEEHSRSDGATMRCVAMKMRALQRCARHGWYSARCAEHEQGGAVRRYAGVAYKKRCVQIQRGIGGRGKMDIEGVIEYEGR